MNFRLLTISSIYPGYLQSFLSKNYSVKELSYNDHYNALLDDSTEFVSSYTKTFIRLGVDAKCVIANNNYLQERWRIENNIESKKSKKIVFEQVKKYKPDVLLIEGLRFVDKEWLDTVKKEVNSIKLVVANHCAPYSSKLLEVFKNIDFLITCTPGMKSEFEKHGIRSYAVYHGFDSELLEKIDADSYLSKHNFIFSGSLFPGNGYHKERIELIEAILKENIDISLYTNLENSYKIKAKQSIYLLNSIFKKIGFAKLNSYFPLLEYGEEPIKSYSDSLYKVKQQPVYGLDMYKLFKGSKVVLNNHGEVAGDYAGNMRLFEVTGVGSCLLTDSKKNMSELFERDYEVVVYDTPEDCIRKVKWLLENEEERKKIAYAGQQRTLKSHTVEDRCNQIIEIVSNELDK